MKNKEQVKRRIIELTENIEHRKEMILKGNNKSHNKKYLAKEKAELKSLRWAYKFSSYKTSDEIEERLINTIKDGERKAIFLKEYAPRSIRGKVLRKKIREQEGKIKAFKYILN